MSETREDLEKWVKDNEILLLIFRAQINEGVKRVIFSCETPEDVKFALFSIAANMGAAYAALIAHFLETDADNEKTVHGLASGPFMSGYLSTLSDLQSAKTTTVN